MEGFSLKQNNKKIHGGKLVLFQNLTSFKIFMTSKETESASFARILIGILKFKQFDSLVKRNVFSPLLIIFP